MITFYSVLPDRLNLNGDQANLFVLQQRLLWMGIQSHVEPINNLDDLERLAVAFSADPTEKFLLLGHGSKAAISTFSEWRDELRDAVLKLAAQGLPGLAVGNGYEALFPEASRVDRVSDYADFAATDELPAIRGYVNTDSNLPHVQLVGKAFVCTFVHGPVLARSPELADLLLTQMGIEVRPNSDSAEADGFAASISEG